MKIFKKCAELEKIDTRSLLSLNLETRWNATYLMFENVEKFEKAFARLDKFTDLSELILPTTILPLQMIGKLQGTYCVS